MVKRVSSKNGLIELFRFLCAIWVAYYHEYFPILSDKFDGVNISVDFFFMVTGLFFLKSIEKYREQSFWKGTKFIFWSRTKRFIVPLIIAALAVLWCNLMIELTFNGLNFPFIYLWFFVAQFIFLSLFYLILKNTKRMSTFNIICVVIICLSMSFFKLELTGLDIFARGPAMLALGMLLSQVPEINIKANSEAKSQKLNLTVNIIGFTVATLAFLYLAYLPKFQIWKLHLFTCIVCPTLLYFAKQIPVRSKFLNFLGECSIYIYLAQCPILLHHFYISDHSPDQFPLLCVCAVAFLIINRVANKLLTKRRVVA